VNKILIHAISDTHNRHDKIKGLDGGDLIIHAGDWSSQGHLWENTRFLDWYCKLRYPAKVLIAGNHERGVEADEAVFKQMCKERGIIYLNDTSVELQFVPGIVYIDQNIPDLPKFKIHGSPVTPWFFDWAWNRSIRDDHQVYDPRQGNRGGSKSVQPIKPHWDMIPMDTDILVTHGPPVNILDELLYVDGTPKGQFVGCPHLAERIKEVKPDLHIFGHIHCGHGEKHVDGVSYYNVSICDEMYGPSNSVTVIEYEKEEDNKQENNGSKDIALPE
jgi:predicted phosphodiesterase